MIEDDTMSLHGTNLTNDRIISRYSLPSIPCNDGITAMHQYLSDFEHITGKETRKNKYYLRHPVTSAFDLNLELNVACTVSPPSPELSNDPKNDVASLL